MRRDGIGRLEKMMSFGPNRKANFSRSNQPRACRMCGKLSTWSEANGNGGLDLCKGCYEAASLDNEHYDGYHETPHAACRLCKEETK